MRMERIGSAVREATRPAIGEIGSHSVVPIPVGGNDHHEIQDENENK